MATGTQIHGKVQFFDISGNCLSGGKVYIYEVGTTTNKVSYTIPACTGGTENTQPVILDSRGEANIYVLGNCKIKVQDAASADIYTLDNVRDIEASILAQLAASSGSSLVGYLPAGTGSVAGTVQAKLREVISVADKGGDKTGTTDSTSNFVNAFNETQIPIIGSAITDTYKSSLFNTDAATMNPASPTNTYWTARLLPVEKYIQNRTPFLLKTFISGRTTGLMLGNSIAAGTGTASYPLYSQIQFKLRDWFNLGNYSEWACTNYGIGGSTINSVAMLVGDSNALVRNPILGGGAKYAVLVCTRNDIAFLTVTQYVMALENTLAALKARGIFTIMVFEPPLITYSTGVIVETAAAQGYFDAAESLCATYGASVVDSWNYFKDLKSLGVDLRPLMSDGTHPNQDGYAIIGDMIFKCLMNRSLGEVSTLPVNSGHSQICSFHNLTPNGGVTTLASTTGNSVRGFLLGAASQGLTLTGGTNTTFAIDVPPTAVLIELAPGSSGTVTVAINNVNIATGVATVNSGVASFVIPVMMYNSYSNWKNNGTLKITNTAGTQIINGVSILSGEQVSPATLPSSVNTGTWSNSTLPTGETCYQSATINDTCEFDFTGSALSFFYSRGNATGLGKIDVTIDGVFVVTLDCYAALGADFSTQYVKELAQGNHFVQLKVQTKNAASAGNNIKIGKVGSTSDFRFSTKVVHVPISTSTLPTNASTVLQHKSNLFPANISLTLNSSVNTSAACIINVS